MSSFVEEILGLVEIFLVAGDEIEFRQGHFRYLMPRYACHLAWIVADFAADAVGIFDGYVEEVAFAGGLIVGDGSLHHVPEVVELMAEIFHFFPAFRACPVMWMFGIHGATCVEVAVWFLGCRYDHEHAVDILLKFFVGECLECVACSLYGLVDVGVVKRQSADLDGVGGIGGLDEIGVAACLLTFAECERDGHVAAGF